MSTSTSAKGGAAAPEGSAASGAGHRRAAVRLISWISVVAGVVLLAYHLSDIFAPLIGALVLAYMLDPLVARLEKRGWSRKKAVLVIFLSTLVLMVALVAGTIPFVVRDLSGSVAALSGEYNDVNWNGRLDADEVATFSDRDGDGQADPGYIVRLNLWMAENPRLREVAKWVEHNKVPDRVAAWARENAREIAERSLDFGSAGARAVGNAIWSVAWIGMTLLLFPIYLYCFLVGLGGIRKKSFALVPPEWRSRFERMASEIGTALAAFFRGRLVIVLAIGAFTALSLGVWLKLGVVLGIAIGLASIVPFLNIAFLVPAMFVAGLEYQAAWAVILVVVLYAVGQLLDPLLTPYLLSRSTGMHPITVIVSLFVWARLLGVVGLLLAVPLTAAAKVIGRELVLPLLAGADPEPEHAPGGRE